MRLGCRAGLLELLRSVGDTDAAKIEFVWPGWKDMAAPCFIACCMRSWLYQLCPGCVYNRKHKKPERPQPTSNRRQGTAPAGRALTELISTSSACGMPSAGCSVRCWSLLARRASAACGMLLQPACSSSSPSDGYSRFSGRFCRRARHVGLRAQFSCPSMRLSAAATPPNGLCTAVPASELRSMLTRGCLVAGAAG